jgi:hypothetical protein
MYLEDDELKYRCNLMLCRYGYIIKIWNLSTNIALSRLMLCVPGSAISIVSGYRLDHRVIEV